MISWEKNLLFCPVPHAENGEVFISSTLQSYLLRSGARIMMACVYGNNRTQVKLNSVFQCIISSSRPPVEPRQIKIPFPPFPLVVLRAEDCAGA